jgi:hypothetical protein
MELYPGDFQQLRVDRKELCVKLHSRFDDEFRLEGSDLENIRKVR